MDRVPLYRDFITANTDAHTHGRTDSQNGPNKGFVLQKSPKNENCLEKQIFCVHSSPQNYPTEVSLSCCLPNNLTLQFSVLISVLIIFADAASKYRAMLYRICKLASRIGNKGLTAELVARRSLFFVCLHLTRNVNYDCFLSRQRSPRSKN